jgi:hypothetical protein
MLVGMSVSAANAVLRQLAASYGVTIGQSRCPNPTGGDDLVVLTALSATGEQWTAICEGFYEAACELAELMGFELADG